jgi:hypothetical protein
LSSAASNSAFFFAAAAVLFVDVDRVVFFATGAGASDSALSVEGSAFFLPLGFAAVVAAVLVLIFFFATTPARSEAAESVFLARGLAAVEAYRRLWR